ncbi:DUF5606 family protein [Halocola ammonii]
MIVLKDLLSISGKPGLFKVVTQSKNSLIVESLNDGKKMPVYAAHKISALEDISIYTYSDDVPLAEVYQEIYDKEEGGKAIDPKKSSAQEMRDYMVQVLPDYDEDRVYQSDLKKLFSWYNLLHDHNLLEVAKEEESEDEEPAESKSDKSGEEE